MHILSKGLGGKFISVGKPKKLAGGQILILPTVCWSCEIHCKWVQCITCIFVLPIYNTLMGFMHSIRNMAAPLLSVYAACKTPHMGVNVYLLPPTTCSSIHAGHCRYVYVHKSE